jgi:hypothetical protein
MARPAVYIVMPSYGVKINEAFQLCIRENEIMNLGIGGTLIMDLRDPLGLWIRFIWFWIGDSGGLL